MEYTNCGEEKIKTPNVLEKINVINDKIDKLSNILSPVLTIQNVLEVEKTEKSESSVMYELGRISSKIDSLIRSIDIN